MKFRPKNYKDNVTKLMELSYKLNSMIEDGSFYALSFLDRYKEIRKIKSLYSKLRGPVSEKGLEQAVSFAAVLMLIGGARCGSSSGDIARVTIDLGLHGRNKAVQNVTRAAAPSKVTEIALTVSGPGMADIVESVDITTGAITLDVPAGDARVFEVRANLPTDAYLFGSAVQNLPAGESVDVPITMRLQGPPTFAKATANPFGLTNQGDENVYPSFADIDGDGDLDLFSTLGSGTTNFFKNNTAVAGGTPSFASRVTNPYNLSSYTNYKTFVDIDGDGDLDVVSSGYRSTFYYYNMIWGYTNNGPQFSSSQPLVPGTFPFSPVASRYFNVNFVSPIMAFVDIDNDADPDLFIGGQRPYTSSNIQYLENINDSSVFGTPIENAFGLPAIDNSIISNANFLDVVSPAFVDIDGDGDFDLFLGVGWHNMYPSGSYFNDILFFENTGTAGAPSFAAPVLNPFGISGIADGTYSSRAAMAFPAFADIDGDGDIDMFIGDGYGNIHYYENTAL